MIYIFILILVFITQNVDITYILQTFQTTPVLDVEYERKRQILLLCIKKIFRYSDFFNFVGSQIIIYFLNFT
jgi:hypothetical protein